MLDFTLVAVSELSGMGRPLSQFGYLPLIPKRGKIRIGDSVNIIQYPQGQEKSVVVHNSNLLHMEDGTDLEPYLWYSSDTEHGSSGSPVFNNRWEIIALHHRAVPSTDEVGRIMSVNNSPMTDQDVDADQAQVRWVANEGVRASVIVQVVRSALIEDKNMRAVRDGLIGLWDNTLSGLQGAESSRRENQRPAYSDSELATAEIPLGNGASVRVTMRLTVQAD
jgi:endonuclease G